MVFLRGFVVADGRSRQQHALNLCGGGVGRGLDWIYCLPVHRPPSWSKLQSKDGLENRSATVVDREGPKRESDVN